MLVDWFTVFAQMLNFLILVVLLKRFLYRPILDAMEARRARIAAELEEAAGKMQQAEEAARQNAARRVELEESRERLLEEARAHADARRRTLLDEARNDAEAGRERWRSAIEQERESFLRDLRRRTVGQVFTIARKALSDLAGADLEERIVEVFLERLHGWDEAGRSEAAVAIRRSGSPIAVRSSFELSESLREKVATAIRGWLGQHVTVDFEVTADPVCGIELRVAGLELAWDLESYLDGLEEELARSLAVENGGERM